MISIIIPTLNEEKILASTLEAIKKLTAVDYELIISDGHSTDKTVEIARRFADKIVEHDGKTRQNIAQGRNAGAAAASGEFLVIMDSDVTIPDIDHFFLKLLKAFEADQKIVGMMVGIKVWPHLATFADRVIFDIINLQYFVQNNIFNMGAASGEFQMIRAEAFKKLGGYNERLIVGEDQDMFARLSKLGRVRMDNKVHVLHTSRRAHAIGWPKLLWLWWSNYFSYMFRKRSISKEWEVIR